MELLLKHNGNYYQIKTCKIKEDITSYTVADITLETPDLIIKKYDNIQIIEVNQVDNIIFDGFCEEPEVGDEMKLTCKGNKALLNNKLVVSNKTLTSKTITEIMTSLITDWNNNTGDNLTFFCGDNTIFPQKDFKQGDNFADILDELSKALDLNYTFKNLYTIFSFILVDGFICNDLDIFSDTYNGIERQIIVGIGEVKDFIAIHNKDDARNSNIDNIISKGYGTQVNVVFGTDGTLKSSLNDFSLLTERIGIYESYRAGNITNLNNNILQTLTQRKTPQKVLDLKLKQGEGEDLEIGDTITVIIENLDIYRNFNGSAIVNSKEINYINGSKIINIGVSDIIVVKDEINNKLMDISKSVRLKKL